jgi:hypothetical protein
MTMMERLIKEFGSLWEDLEERQRIFKHILEEWM